LNKRPTWAIATNALINESAPKSIPNKAKANPFLQTWNTPEKGKRTEHLDKDMISLIKIVKKFNITFAPINLSRNLKESLLAWFHPGTIRNTLQNPAVRCLIQNHSSHNIKDLVRITRRLTQEHSHLHIPVFLCPCDNCELDQINGCENPQKCAAKAQKRLNRITPKSQPNHPTLDNDLSLMRRRKQKKPKSMPTKQKYHLQPLNNHKRKPSRWLPNLRRQNQSLQHTHRMPMQSPGNQPRE
jgi:hypothetical protein